LALLSATIGGFTIVAWLLVKPAFTNSSTPFRTRSLPVMFAAPYHTLQY
jgi:hypothetical protein